MPATLPAAGRPADPTAETSVAAVGVIRGDTITLGSTPDLPAGAVVSVRITAESTEPESAGVDAARQLEGLRRTFGCTADRTDLLDEFDREVLRDRGHRCGEGVASR